MELILMRHSATLGNEERRYIGSTDDPLSEKGIRLAEQAGSCPRIDRVYISPLMRVRETALICFPNAEQISVPGLQEMDFGVFENRNADEMFDDAEYRAWVDSGCMTKCPGGESRAEFTKRTVTAVEKLLYSARMRYERRVVVVAHGGTIMAAMEAFSSVPKSYYNWRVNNCEGYRMQVIFGKGKPRFEHPVHFQSLGFLNAR